MLQMLEAQHQYTVLGLKLMVKLLLQRGADIDNPGGTSRTPPQLAMEATSEMFREMGTPGSDLDYARIANILRSRSLRQ